MKKIIQYSCLSFCLLALVLALGLRAHAQTPAPAAAAPAAAAPAPTVPADAELKDAAGKAPTTMDLAKGDPGGTITGTINDVPAADSKAGVTVADVANQVGQNKIAANFIWTLVTGFLVMFMQAGFAMVESGLCRVKNANHTYMMNFFVYTCGLFAYWILGFAIQMGGSAGNSNLGGLNSLTGEHSITLFGKTWGLFGQAGYFLSGHTYDVGVMVIFLFEMVFMDTALTIVTGACAERWKFATFAVSSVIMGAITYPLYGNWAWGGGWLSQLGSNSGLGKGYCDFAGSGVVHAVGGLTALAVSYDHRRAHRQVQPRWVTQSNHRPRHLGRADRLLHPRLRLVRVQPRQHAGRFRKRQLAHRDYRRGYDAGRLHGDARCHPLHVDRQRKTRRLDDR